MINKQTNHAQMCNHVLIIYVSEISFVHNIDAIFK